MPDVDEFFKNELNTGLMGFVTFEELLLAKYSEAEQTDIDYWCPILFYTDAGKLVGYYDLEMHEGFIG